MNQETNNNVSTSTLNVFIPIITVVFLVITYFDIGNKFSFDQDKFVEVFYIILGALIITIIVNWKSINKFINNKISRIKLLNAVTFEYRKGFFEILDTKGKKVIYTEDCLIKRIKKKFLYKGVINCDGEIDRGIQTFNCYHSLNNSNDKITIIYGKKEGSEIESIVNKKQVQFGFAVKMINGFTKKKDYWEYAFTHYTKVYDLKMSFPKKRPPKYVGIYQENKKTATTKFTEIAIDPLIIEKKNKTLVKIKLLHLEKGSRFRVYWKW